MIEGIRLGTTSAGIRQTERDDLAVIEISEGSNVVSVFTLNAFCAAPVTIAKQHLSATTPKYLLINSGNANAGTGASGHRDCLDTCQMLADKTSSDLNSILPFSTGVIGERLPIKLFNTAITAALKNLTANGWKAASRAIMTTDTCEKRASLECEINGKKIKIEGMAKGSGMIRPNMATMLAYVATDASVETELLQHCLQESVDKSFNRITVDGDTSTNDACVLIATGKSNIEVKRNDREQFQKAVDEVFIKLAHAIVKDGEGATKFISIEVFGGKTDKECREIGYCIAHSPLVKTAFFASDPNWGRLLAAIGRADVEQLDVSKISIMLGDVHLIENGEPAETYTEEQGASVMKKDEIAIKVDLGRGAAVDTVWTCDLSYDYVRINAEYRT
ncbi:MAG: bifunctional glutamate N-acetyltransferase/amino-acid acetyltransferase ArgJ [Gammaproteobacteria bacterium]